ncbi:MAG TPA: dienelactone hydrolase family protein [Patescibacteria group bacterium]|nr:dienelactone hydrolase family protein [Patescibacteria group bacterium]
MFGQSQICEAVQISFGGLTLPGELTIPERNSGIVLFAHGSGSSRHSPRNKFVAGVLREHCLGTLLFDLLTPAEEEEDRLTGHLRFDIAFLAQRLLGATRWCQERERTAPIGYFGSSTGGGAALVAATQSETPIAAIVSRGGRPDLAGDALPNVKAPTLLLVGSKDTTVIEMNRSAAQRMKCRTELRLIPGATHLFEEPGTLEQVSGFAAQWFKEHFNQAPRD